MPPRKATPQLPPLPAGLQKDPRPEFPNSIRSSAKRSRRFAGLISISIGRSSEFYNQWKRGTELLVCTLTTRRPPRLVAAASRHHHRRPAWLREQREVTTIGIAGAFAWSLRVFETSHASGRVLQGKLGRCRLENAFSAGFHRSIPPPPFDSPFPEVELSLPKSRSPYFARPTPHSG